MLVGYMRVSTADERQSVDLQRDALQAAGVDERHLHEDRGNGFAPSRVSPSAARSAAMPGSR
jgi:DNA invertase Pin-like site-specific DNA recombinase